MSLRFHRALRAGVLLCGFLTAPLSAVSASKPWIAREPSGGEQTAQERLQHDRRIVAECAAKGNHGDVAVFLNLPTGHPDYAKAEMTVSRLFYGCASAKIGYGAPVGFASRDVIFVGLLAVAMMRRFERPQLPVLDESPYDFKRSFMEVEGNGSVQRMALCLTDGQPDKVVEVIVSRPGSSLETQRLKALAPYIGLCLAKGVTLTLGRPEFRAVLAEALYHRLFEPITQQQIDSAKAVPHA